MPGRIAIVGATGFLGRVVVPRCVAAGQTVRMIARHRPPDLPPGVEFVLCDATDGQALLAALDGCSIVANLSSGRPADIQCIARHLSAAMHRNRIAKLIHVSSLAVFGAGGGLYNETSRPCPHPSHRYAVSKVEAERLLAPQVAAGRCVIIRPGCIYGPGAPVWTHSVGRLLLRERLGNLGSAGAGIAPLVNILHAAAAVVAAIDAPAGIYHLLPSAAISWNEYFCRFAHALGMRAVPKISGIGWATETWLRSPAIMLRAHLTRSRPDIISPAMRRLFATRARIVAGRALCPPDPLGSHLHRVLAETAETIRNHARDNNCQPGAISAIKFS